MINIFKDYIWPLILTILGSDLLVRLLRRFKKKKKQSKGNVSFSCEVIQDKNSRSLRLRNDGNLTARNIWLSYDFLSGICIMFSKHCLASPYIPMMDKIESLEPGEFHDYLLISDELPKILKVTFTWDDDHKLNNERTFTIYNSIF